MILDVQVLGEKVAAEHIGDIGERARDMRPALLRVQKLLREGIGHQFASHGGFFGSSWGSADLVATGALKASLLGGPGSSGKVTRSSASVGTKVWWAHFAQKGTDHTPPRTVVGVAPSTAVSAMQALERYLTHGLI